METRIPASTSGEKNVREEAETCQQQKPPSTMFIQSQNKATISLPSLSSSQVCEWSVKDELLCLNDVVKYVDAHPFPHNKVWMER